MFLIDQQVFADSNTPCEKCSEVAQMKEWLYLNQYTSSIFGGFKSRIDDATFFFSESGKTSPTEELYAAWQGLNKNPNEKCRFPARFAFLQKHFPFNKKVLSHECVELNEWKRSLNVSRVALIFPAAYLNNPASMFGHTLLRLDSVESLENPLLSYAAGFSASTGSDGGIAFAVKGLFGGYRASFSVEPYYETVKRYGDIEHRDIWEYPLDLNEDEIEVLLNALWELGHTYVDYYFFDENCSLYLLALLEIVRPDLTLVDAFWYWIIPAETLKKVVRDTDLYSGGLTFRPSLSTILEEKGQSLSSSEIASAKTVSANDDLTSLSSQYLDFAYDYLEYRVLENDVDAADARKTARKILLEQTKKEAPPKTIYAPQIAPPDSTHGASRMLSGVGVRDSKSFGFLEYKPAYHELLDSDVGFTQGAAIDFFSTKLRYYESDRVQLDAFIPVSIQSYAPWTRVFHPISWGVRGGARRERMPKEDFIDRQGSLGFFIEGDVGMSFKLLDVLDLNALLQPIYITSPSYVGDTSSFGLGGRLSARLKITESFTLLTQVGNREMFLGNDYGVKFLRQDVRIGISDEVSIVSGFERSSAYGNYLNEGTIGLALYF